MRGLRRFIASAVLSALTLTPTFSYAACATTDLVGWWQAYSLSVDNSGAWWSRCLIYIYSNGTIANSSCANSTGATAQLRSGRAYFINARICTFRAYFYTAGEYNLVSHATLARDKLTANGVGGFSGGFFTFTLTRL